MDAIKEMWEERFSGENYAYGTEPNEFFRRSLDVLSPGRILLPADGEGRNGVYAATRGWDVHSLDFSYNARKKAVELANLKGVHIHYLISDLFLYPYPHDRFDAIALVYVHMPPEKRKQLHQHVVFATRPGGAVILEAFSKNQVRYSSGGPRDEAMLYSVIELREDFKNMEIEFLSEEEIITQEGLFHEGKASVVRMVAKKI
jgi:SAM-dependent methyltransferase